MAESLIDKYKLEPKPTRCKKCGGELEYVALGEYKCRSCGYVEMDDFGKIRTFLAENGPSPAIVINQATGVSLDKINSYLRQGKIEIPEGSNIYIRCENCGTEIRYGRFCPACAAKLSKSLQGIEIGETPKVKRANTGKMRFIGSDKK